MRAAQVVAVVALVLSSSVLARGSARADDADPVDAVKKAFRKVDGCIHDCLPTAAQAALPDAEQQLAALDDFHKGKVAKDAERTRTRLKAMLDHLDADQVKASVAHTVENAQSSVSRNQGDGRDIYREYNEALKLFDDQISDEMNKKLIDADTVAQLQKKIEGIKVDFKRARVREAVNSWENDEKEIKIEHKGWEEDTKPYAIDRVCGGWEIGCERTVQFVDRIDRWLEAWKTTLEASPDDPTLKKLCADLETQRTAAQAKIAEFRKAIFAEAENLPPGEQRDTMGRFYHSFLMAGDADTEKKGARRKSAGVGPGPGDEELVPKITALVERWDAEKSKGKTDKEALIKELIAGSSSTWPGLLKGFSLVKLETSEALKDPAKWKGKTGKIVGENFSGGVYEDQYRVIVEVDGVPVCGDFDSGLAASFGAFAAFAEKNGLKLGATQEYVGTVDGTCKVWQRVKRGDKFIRGDQIDGVKVRIVALKTERFAGAAGQGPNLDNVSTGSAPGSSSAPGGTFHFIHRLVAWGMCGLLALCGALAVAVGASPFVPAIQAQRVKLGHSVGYAGLAFAGIGVLWFGAAMLFWIVEGRGGSLPSLALILAGAFTGVAVLRSKGEIMPPPTAEGAAVVPPPPPASPDMLTTIQPAGILLGLGCFGAAAIHFLLWDWLLL